MTELRFNRDVYSGPAVDESVKLFAQFATFQLAEESDCWVVRVSTANHQRERQIARELANYALGLTIERRRAT